MKRIYLPILIVASFFLILSGCGEGEAPKSEGTKAKQEDVGSSALIEKKQLGLVKGPTRPHPGWVCPSHPNMKSFQPGTCPIDGMTMVREGEWTCPNHPQVSATAPGTCPIDDEPLIKVEELEKKAGKRIDVLTEEALAKTQG